jgi:hypothetical protein
MRLVLLLVVVAIIGITLSHWLKQQPATAVISPQAGTLPTPAVPTRPQDVKKFEQDINRFMQDAAKQRSQQEPQ